jgi:DNA-directed RNA polymerase I subunit RPA49
VYALHDIIPEKEWKAISVSALANADSHENRIAALPHRRSNWVNQHLAQAFTSDSPNKRAL